MADESGPATVRMAASNQTALIPASLHRDESFHSEDSQSNFSVSQSSNTPDVPSTTASLSWQPVYLRRVVLLGFIVLFILIVIAIEILLIVSNNNNGIVTASPSGHYLWTYGPTAFLTGVAALWGRTEYQSKLVAPWIRLSKNRQSKQVVSASRILLLDYVSQFSPFAVFSSLRNGDFAVFITLTVSIIIKVLIVLSSGLISLELTSITQGSYPVVLESSFVDSNARLATTDQLARYITTGFESSSLTFPEGISSEYAFQSMRSNLSSVSQARVVIDGLRSSLQCEPARLNLTGTQYFTTIAPGLFVNISSADCNSISLTIGGTDLVEPKNNSRFLGAFQRIQCDTIMGVNGRRIAVLFAQSSLNTSHDYTFWSSKVHPPVEIKSTQLLCTPTYSIDRVQAIRSGIQTTIVPSQGTPSRMLNSVTGWDIMDAHFAAIGGDVSYYPALHQSMAASTVNSATPVYADAWFDAALHYRPVLNSPAAALFDPTALQHTFEAYYRLVSSIISKASLMEPTVETVLGSATVRANRLVIRPVVAQSMAALLIICVFLTATIALIIPTHGFLPHNPSNFPYLILLLLWSRELLAWLRCAGASDGDHLVRWLKPSTLESGLAYDTASGQAHFCVSIGTEDVDKDENEKRHPFPQISSKFYHPIIIHPASRAILCLSVAGLIAALEILLHKSNLEDGLGNANEYGNTYIHYTWTTIPAIIFGVVSMVYSAMDFQIRVLTPYMALKNYVSKDVFTHLDLLDMTIPVAIYKEFRLKTPWALATTTALLFASLFSTMSASLFQELSIPLVLPVVLQANRSYYTNGSSYAWDAENVKLTYNPTLVLESNLSFPRFTYDDLAFLQLIQISQPSSPNTHYNESSVSIAAIIPALRPRMTCRSYKPTSIHANLVLNYTDAFDGHNPVEISIDGENCHGDNFPIAAYSNATYFGYTYYGNYDEDDLVMSSCSSLLYVWGKIDYAANPAVQYVNALGCNITFEAVDVNTTFISTEFDIDFQNPPKPLEDTARETTINGLDKAGVLSMNILNYEFLAKIDTYPQILDNFFSVLVTSRWAVPMAALGDPSASADVIAAIKFHHGIIQAQTFAQALSPAELVNATTRKPVSPGDDGAQPGYDAVLTDTQGRRRVVQDAASTHVLAALLGVTLVLFIAGWRLSPSADVLPRSPTTIASAVALLAGGNVFSHLQPHDGNSPEDVMAALGGPNARFWMGWGNMPDEEGILMGGENEAGVSQFGIFVVDEAETESE